MRSITNVGQAERWASVIGGAAMAAAGIKRLKERDQPAGALMAAAAAAMIVRGATGHCNVYQAGGINTAADSGDTRARLGGSAGTHVEEAVTIGRRPEELFDRWRELEWLPQVIPFLRSVQQTSEGRSHWVAIGPGGRTVEWTAEIINQIHGRLIAWRTIGTPDVVSAGSVHFDPLLGDRGTIVRVRLQYEPPAGKIGSTIARVIGRDPSQALREGLRRFKQLIEAGEIPVNRAQPRGAR